MKKYFPAAADGAVWVVTTSLVAVGIVLLVLAGAIGSLPTTLLIVIYAIAGVIALVLLAGWLAKPVRYEVRDESLTIVRAWPFPRIIIPRSALKKVESVHLRSLSPASITLAFVFGYSGVYRASDLGPVFVVATSPRDAVLIEADRKYLVSPANPKRFIQDLTGKR